MKSEAMIRAHIYANEDNHERIVKEGYRWVGRYYLSSGTAPALSDHVEDLERGGYRVALAVPCYYCDPEANVRILEQNVAIFTKPR
jgi:hypothetical protein